MFQTNYIFKAQYLGRRLESIYRVARRWKITNKEAAELMVNVEMLQSDNTLNQYKLFIEGPVYRGNNLDEYKLFIEGPVYRGKINLLEYKLFIEGPTIYSDYGINLLDKKKINKYRRLNNIETDYEMEEKKLLEDDTVFLNSLSSNNSSNQFIQKYDTNLDTNLDTNQYINQTSKKFTKRRHTTNCCCF